MTASTFQGATTVLDSVLFRDAFGTPAIRDVFSDRSLISRYIAVEVALARAQARCGVIPADAADVIASRRRSNLSIWTCCAARPTSSATPSCRWCTSSRR